MAQPKPVASWLTLVFSFQINIDPIWKVVDPDENEYHTWSRIFPSKDFDVDDDTGSIFSKQEIDIDPNKEFDSFNVKVRVTDRGGLSADGQIEITVLDKNDNVPIFDKVGLCYRKRNHCPSLSSVSNFQYFFHFLLYFSFRPYLFLLLLSLDFLSEIKCTL